MTSFNSVLKFLYLPYPVPAKVILGILLVIVTPVVLIWTGLLQTSCHPMLWWQQGTNPACWQFSVEPESPVELQVGDSHNFTAATGNSYTNHPSFTWQVEDGDIATFQVSESNHNIDLFATKAGKTVLSVRPNPQFSDFLMPSDIEIPKAAVPIKVMPKLGVTPKSLPNLKVGNQMTVKAYFVATSIEKIQESFPQSQLEWSVEDPEIATIDRESSTVYGSKATLTATKVGKTKLQVRFRDGNSQIQQTLPATIEKPIVTNVDIQLQEQPIFPGETYPLVSKVTGDGNFDPSVTWSSSNPQVATIETPPNENEILLTAYQPGETVVTAKSNHYPEKQDSKTIRVFNPQDALQIFPASLSIEKDQTQKLAVTWNIEPRELQWSAKNPEIATVNGSGQVTAKQVGETSIQVGFATGNAQFQQEIPIQVRQKTMVTGVSIVSKESSSRKLFPGETFQLATRVTGEGDFHPMVTWSSSNPQVAAIATQPNNREVTLQANQPGTVTVTAKSDRNPEQQDSQTIQINDPQKIFQITPNPLSVEPGIWQDLSVILNEKPIKNDRVIWQSNQPNAIDVNNGRVCAYKSSSAAEITATLPANYSVNYPRLQNRISVQSKSIENKSSWLKRLGVDVGSCVVAGVGTTVLTANPLAGIAACVGAAAISETSIRVVEGGNRVAVDTCQPPEK